VTATVDSQSMILDDVTGTDIQRQCAATQALKVAQKLLDAIRSSLSSDAHEFTRAVAEACLLNGFQTCPAGFQLVPVSCCEIGAAVKQQCPDMQGKLIANLQQQKCRSFFRLIPGPPEGQPAVLLKLSAMINKPYSNALGKIMSKLHISEEHPQLSNQEGNGSSSGSENADVTEVRCAETKH